MARAVTLGTKRRGGSVAARSWWLLGGLVLAACAGGGKDRDFSLPARLRARQRTLRQGARGRRGAERVRRRRNCVRGHAGPMSSRNGNTRGLALYRLGTTGLLLGNSPNGRRPSSASPPTTIRAAWSSIRPIQALLYVATRAACKSFASGRRRQRVHRRDRRAMKTCETAPRTGPRRHGNRRQHRQRHPLRRRPRLGSDRRLYDRRRRNDPVPAERAASSAAATRSSRPRSPMGDGFFAAGGSVRIEMHPRVQGQFLAEPDPNATVTPTPVPTASPSPDPDATPGPLVALAGTDDMHRCAPREHAAFGHR